MRSVRKIHYWIGIIATVFLLIESATGIIMYFQEGGKRSGIERPGGMNAFGGNTSGQNGSAIAQGSGAGASASAAGSSDKSGSDSGQADSGSGTVTLNGGSPSSDRMGDFRRPEGSGSLGMSVRSLHQGIVGLISGVAMFVLTGTGVAMSLMIWRAGRKKKIRGTAARTTAPPGNIS